MNRSLRAAAVCCLLSGLLSGCASNSKQDPLEPLNRGIYQFNDTVDRAVLKPVATLYKKVTPQPVQFGVRNFFGNLDDVMVAFNNLLQFKIREAVSDGGRVLINTTFGVLGLFDIASRTGMQKHYEDFGQTLGAWRVGNGPFLMLPLLGPSTLRDSAGLLVDRKGDVLNNNIDKVPQRNRALTLKTVNRRAELLDSGKLLDQAALDPYQFLRDAYLQKRRSQVYDGNPPPEPDENGDTEPPWESNTTSFESQPARIAVEPQPLLPISLAESAANNASSGVIKLELPQSAGNP